MTARGLPARPGALALGALLALAGCAPRPAGPSVPGSISGRVTYPGDLPAGGSTVVAIRIASPNGLLVMAATDTGGRYAFGGLDPGSYVISCRDFSTHVAAETASVSQAAPVAHADLELREQATILGTVTLAGRADHRGTVVTVPQLLALGGTDSTGHFALAGVPAGRWPVEATHFGFLTGTATATVPAPGDTVTLAPIQLAPGPAPAARRRG